MTSFHIMHAITVASVLLESALPKALLLHTLLGFACDVLM